MDTFCELRIQTAVAADVKMKRTCTLCSEEVKAHFPILASRQPYLGHRGVHLCALTVGVCLCTSSVDCKYCPSVSEELLCTQPQPTQQTLPTPILTHPPPLKSSSIPPLHLLCSNSSGLYYFINQNHTPPLHSFSLPDIKHHDLSGK